ncbi:hypothetical protein [Longibaculum muris]|uniref:hypothetical protein n=1 Tax=Longibaculum muris TaxID=1796628 RepID=UPI0022E24AB2|nr:hypothetical protein [Longibaculum muris]
MSLFNLFKKEKNMNQSNCISQESDTPIPFGMKISWLVVKEKDPNTVMKKLNCTDIEVSNWQSAFSHMQKMKKVFVTPCFNGYVLILNYNEPLENKELLQDIASKFEEIHYFSTHRIVDLSCWVKYINGKLMRSFYYVGEQGEIFWNEGELTNEEKEIGLTSSSFDLEAYDESTIYPNEEIVDALAAEWGVNLFLDEYQETKSTGFLCHL